VAEVGVSVTWELFTRQIYEKAFANFESPNPCHKSPMFGSGTPMMCMRRPTQETIISVVTNARTTMLTAFFEAPETARKKR